MFINYFPTEILTVSDKKIDVERSLKWALALTGLAGP